MADRRWSDADRKLVAQAVHDHACMGDDCSWSEEPSACDLTEFAGFGEAVLDALTADGWRDVHGLEKPDSILCDCDPDQDGHEPTNPTTGERMHHHCECTAVETVAQLLGETATTHHRQCVCRRPMGETDA